MSRQSELSDEEDIQRGVECTGDLVRDRHAAARQREDNDIASAVKVFDVCSQFDASQPAVSVWLFVTECSDHDTHDRLSRHKTRRGFERYNT
jgi:hypothetical protein